MRLFWEHRYVWLLKIMGTPKTAVTFCPAARELGDVGVSNMSVRLSGYKELTITLKVSYRLTSNVTCANLNYFFKFYTQLNNFWLKFTFTYSCVAWKKLGLSTYALPQHLTYIGRSDSTNIVNKGIKNSKIHNSTPINYMLVMKLPFTFYVIKY